MKTTLPNTIPKERLDEINFIVESAMEELSNKNIEIDKIILFGSYAKGSFVEKDVHEIDGRTEIYKSDFDIMIITKKDLGEEAGGMSVYIEDKISKKRRIETPFTLLLEDLEHVNTMLSMGRYFYSDVKKEGIILLDNSGIELAKRKILTKEEKLEMMKEDYELWFPSAEKFFDNYKFSLSKNYLNEAAFLLHQATERYIAAYLLVKTLYKDRTHDLDFLYNDLQTNDSAFENWFHLDDRDEFRLFQLLRDAYVRARYDKYYKITKEELDFLEKKVLKLRDLVESLCKEEVEKYL